MNYRKLKVQDLIKDASRFVALNHAIIKIIRKITKARKLIGFNAIDKTL